MSALIIMPDGQKLPVAPLNGRDFSLEEAQAIVGGYVQMILLMEGRIMLVNEEAKIMPAVKAGGNDPNPTATMLAHHMGAIAADDYIAGVALVCEAGQFR